MGDQGHIAASRRTEWHWNSCSLTFFDKTLPTKDLRTNALETKEIRDRGVEGWS